MLAEGRKQPAARRSRPRSGATVAAARSVESEGELALALEHEGDLDTGFDIARIARCDPVEDVDRTGVVARRPPDLAHGNRELRIPRRARQDLLESLGGRLVAPDRELERGEPAKSIQIVGIDVHDPAEGLDRRGDVVGIDLGLAEPLQDAIVVRMFLKQLAVDRHLADAIAPRVLELREAHVEQEMTRKAHEPVAQDGLRCFEFLPRLVDRDEGEQPAQLLRFEQNQFLRERRRLDEIPTLDRDLMQGEGGVGVDRLAIDPPQDAVQPVEIAAQAVEAPEEQAGRGRRGIQLERPLGAAQGAVDVVELPGEPREPLMEEGRTGILADRAGVGRARQLEIALGLGELGDEHVVVGGSIRPLDAKRRPGPRTHGDRTGRCTPGPDDDAEERRQQDPDRSITLQ